MDSNTKFIIDGIIIVLNFILTYILSRYLGTRKSKTISTLRMVVPLVSLAAMVVIFFI